MTAERRQHLETRFPANGILGTSAQTPSVIALTQAGLVVLAILARIFVDMWLSIFILVGGVALYLWNG